MRTASTLAALVQSLQANCGDMFDACKKAGVSLQFVSQWRKDDADVNDALKEAEQFGVLGLQSEAIRRAVHGDERGVYFKGELIGTEYNRSDGLLIKLLEAKIPAFSKKEDSGGIHAQNVQINLMPRAETYDDWLRMKDATLARRVAEKALPSPTQNMIDVTPVKNPLEGLGL